ncbi:MAG: helix-turn-helix domain-containing protein [Acholeplasmatales bacterium]|nr:helix-turn-helix domain-containing protein [Acholeplasmatales bacterium]
MDEKQYAIPEYVTARDLKRVRKFLKMTQKEFASFVGVSKPTIERWEASEDKINGPIVLLLNMIENNLNYIDKLSIPKKELPIRMFYMCKQRICTLIDVNIVKQEVRIKNYTNNLMLRAFGINENPTYNDYVEFLKSRCFPETRDKLKLVLEDLGLPFYDPFLIIQKTEGRMAEDDFWLKVEE